METQSQGQYDFQSRSSLTSTALLPGIDPIGVLISIRPSFAQLIIDGTKTIELRRRFPELTPGTIVVLYVTKPLGAAIGIASVQSTTAARVGALWKRFGHDTGITKATFDSYFEDCKEGVAIELANYRKLEQPLDVEQLRALWPDFAPPQSFRYVPGSVLSRLTASATQKAGDYSPVRKVRGSSQSRVRSS
jgi:predicted transcriptional regulator